jgi:hypothetical protein
MGLHSYVSLLCKELKEVLYKNGTPTSYQQPVIQGKIVCINLSHKLISTVHSELSRRTVTILKEDSSIPGRDRCFCLRRCARTGSVIPGRDRCFCLRRCARTCSVTPSVFYPVGTGKYLPRGKVTEAWSWSLACTSVELMSAGGCTVWFLIKHGVSFIL